MNFGNHTNPEIEQLIAQGQVHYGDTVFSTTWNEQLIYNGTVFKSKCGCREIGTKPIIHCETSGGDLRCPNIIRGYITFDNTFVPS